MIHILTSTTSAPITLTASGDVEAVAVVLPAHSSVLMTRAPNTVMEGLQTRQIDALPLIRLLAHLDHVLQKARHPAIPADLAIPLPTPLHSAAQAEAWFIDQLAHDAGDQGDPRIHQLAGYLAGNEDYGLLRFLLQQGNDLPVSTLAERYGLSLAQFNRRCRRVLGGTLKSKLRTQRAARTLLDYTARHRSFTHLAADHGYASLSHFCTEIRDLIGCPPLAVYRAMTTLPG
ncbi:TPA: helix-turn-helix domain-containing protein [Stenotrophomonas maltophilia]|nr:helix-turn-helix domain-containing protein [Stenotrophomonas maltophilia]